MATTNQQTPSTKRVAASITPNDKGIELTYLDIMKQIMSKDSKRTLCPVCANSKDKGNTVNPGCLFYKHEKELIEESNNAMNHPKDNYKNKEEQGARLACYKLWTMLEVGSLGRSRRRPLPVCVETRIKLMKPSTNFQGYKEADNNHQMTIGLQAMKIRGLVPFFRAHLVRIKNQNTRNCIDKHDVSDESH